MPESLLQKLGQAVLIGCGAIGTNLRQAGGAGEEPVELLNLRNPEAVRKLLAAYRAAGSQILVTNTFAANPLLFADAGLDYLCEAANRAGLALAREAAAGDCLVWASIGPLSLGLRHEDYADEIILEAYRRQCAALRDADALLLETFVNPREAAAALKAATETGLPVIFQIGNTGGGRRRWECVDQLLREAHLAGAAAVGTNCHHPVDIVPVAAYIAAHTDLPVTASPNAGHPQIERGLVKYEFTPDDFAATGMALAAAGVAVIGGCCGTKPEHIRKLAAVLAGRPVAARPRIEAVSPPPAPVSERAAAANPLRTLMASSRFLISVEIRADRMQSLDQIVQGAAEIAAAGADMFDVPDNAGATVGRDALVTAARLQEDLAIPSFCHLAATHSNLMRMHSTLIGAWDAGLRGLLAVTGDAPSMGHLGNLVHRVTDVRSSVELLRLIRNLREGKIITGEGLADAPDFCAGCAFGRPVPAQIRWLQAKIEAGAEFVFSQPVFTLDDYHALRDAVAGLPIRFFPGLMPLISQRNAAFLAAGRIPGIVVPPAVAAGFERYHTPADQRRYGLEQAEQLALAIAAEAQGLYIIMPFGKQCYQDTARLVRCIRQEQKELQTAAGTFKPAHSELK